MSKDLAGLPKGWKVLKLGDLGGINGGGTPSTKVPEYWNGEIAWLVPSEVTKNQGLYISKTVRCITQFGLNDCASKLFPIGTVMMTSRATIGEVVINQIPMATNQGFINIGCHENLADNEFLAYWIKKNKTALEALGSGVTFKEISRSTFKTIKISLPPLKEQRAIATTLRTIQTAKEVRQKELALERERKAALMEYLFTHGTRNEPRKQTELSELPESWQVVELKAIAEIQSGGTPSRTRQDYYGGNISWVKTLDLNEGIVNETEEKVTALGLASIRGKIRPVNSVMVAMYGGSGTVGKCGILGIPAVTNQAVCAIEPNPSKFDSFYLLHYMLYFRRDWMRYAGGTRKDPNIGKGIIESTKIPFPSLQEQQEIANVLSSCDAKIATLEREITLHDELFRAMLEELMTGKLSSLPLAN